MSTLGLNVVIDPVLYTPQQVTDRFGAIIGDVFDDIVVTLISEDMPIRAIVEGFSARVFIATATENVSTIRNESFSKSSTDYIFWRTLEDVFSNVGKLTEIKTRLDSVDVFLMRQERNLSDDYPGDYFECLGLYNAPQEVYSPRIIKNTGLILWSGAVCETIDLEGLTTSVEDIQIYDGVAFGTYLDLLRVEYQNPACSNRLKFFYGKELLESGFVSESTVVFKDMVRGCVGYDPYMSWACSFIAKYYYALGEIPLSRNSAINGLNHGPECCQNRVLFGMTCFEVPEDAIEQYKMVVGLGITSVLYCRSAYVMAACKLANIYLAAGNRDDALFLCDRALSTGMHTENVLELRQRIIG